MADNALALVPCPRKCPDINSVTKKMRKKRRKECGRQKVKKREPDALRIQDALARDEEAKSRDGVKHGQSMAKAL